VLSPILSALYFSLIFHIFEKRAKNLKIPVSFLSFVDDELFISQEKSLEKTNSSLFCSHNIISFLLEQFRLVIEHRKSKVLFFQIAWPLQPAPLDLSHFRGPILKPKVIWKYLGFIFDRKLSFQQHIKFYSNKALSIIKYMKMHKNST